MTTMQDRIKGKLGELGLTYYSLAKAADVSVHTVYNLMNGKNDTRPKIIGKIAQALNVTTEYLISGSQA